MSAVTQCQPCGKSFTGPVCYRQHLESEKHKKKLLSLNLLSRSSEACSQFQNTETQNSEAVLKNTETSQLTFECCVCQIDFNSYSNFRTHSNSYEHAQMIIKKNSENNDKAEVYKNSNDILNYKDNNNDENVLEGVSNNNIFPPNEVTKSQILTFAKCEVCNKMFSGPEPYKQHNASAAHKKKVELQKNVATNNVIQNNAEFSCNPCKKIFSGQVPYMQHMESEVHRKKMVIFQYLGKETSEIDSTSSVKESKASESNESIPWFCNCCQIHCSGLIPYQQHLAGITHLKNIARAKNQNCNIKPQDPEQLSLQDKTVSNDTLDAPCMSNGGNIQTNNSDENMDIEYVLSGMKDSLKIMSVEELENSIKTFLPNEAIDFDKPVNRMNANSSNEEIHTSKDNQIHEIKEDPNVYQKCNICNVNLMSKEETISHCESMEHFEKRWHKN